MQLKLASLKFFLRLERTLQHSLWGQRLLIKHKLYCKHNVKNNHGPMSFECGVVHSDEAITTIKTTHTATLLSVS